MLTALKVRLYPSKEQQIALAQNFGCWIWDAG
ncbi:helix-turn-helix domain-containing protein [Floridanema aerugineum]|jgi:transposase|uniref:Helix-turn-helix domain-containing protein n=1 Tax=Floridaenema aerugineum BLCC-F46 TaxID=3153654 RepID=A0ABV4X8J9_9CYAN